MEIDITIYNMKNGKVGHGIAVNYNGAITNKIYIKGDILNVLHFEPRNNWNWNNNGFNSAYHPCVKESEIRKIINMLSECDDDKAKLFYQTAVALFEASEDKGNWR